MDKTENHGGYSDISGNLMSYDDNGNMTSYEDKGIVNIHYNYLNLPENIKFDNYVNRNGVDVYMNTTYLYRADGVKLKKVYNYFSGRNRTNASQTIEYLDGFQYHTTTTGGGNIPNGLQFIPTSEGYYDFIKSKYIYSYTDHLGNIRLSYYRNTTSGSAEVLEENNYYAFGMRQDINILSASNSSYKYQYNGKELQTETGWNDYGARMYMSDIGRWGVIDPLAEQMRRYSPYNYAFNNPVNFVDPDGRKPHNPLEFYGPNSAFNFEFDPLTSLYGTPFNDVGRSPYLRSSLPNQWYYGGSGNSSDEASSPASSVSNESSDNLPEILIQEVVLSSNHSVWGKETLEAFEASMSNWNNTNWWSNTSAMAYTGTLTLPTGGGASAGTWGSIRGLSGRLALGLRAGLWALPLILNGDSSHARGYDIPLTGTTDEPQSNLYLYRNMRSIVGMPELGNSLNTLGVRSTDFLPNVTDSEYVFGSSGQGMSVTPGYGNFIPQTPFANPGKTTLFRIKATDVFMSGLGINIDALDHANITPIGRMTLQQFRLRVQATAPLWKPIK